MNYQRLINTKILLLQLGISFREFGSRFTGRCPNISHRDKNPSWTVYKNTGYHICFSCGFQGSLNHLVKYLTGKTIWEFCQISQPENYMFKKFLDKKSEKKHQELNRGSFIYQSLGNLYSVYSDSRVVNYLLKRKVHPDFIKFFGIKYCNEAVFNYQKYKDRLLIPIREGGRLLSMEGRDFTENQEKKVLYPKGATVNTLFNFDNLDHNKPLIVVEGLMDLHKIWSHITRNVTCTFGNVLTFRQIGLLQNFDCIFMPDNDEAGYNMLIRFDEHTEKEFEIAELPVRYYKILNGKKVLVPGDPGEAFIRELKYALSYKKRAARFFMEKTGIVNNNKITW